MITVTGKIHRALSEETVAFDAIVSVDGVPALDIVSRGTGGSARVLLLVPRDQAQPAIDHLAAEAARIWQLVEPGTEVPAFLRGPSESALMVIPELLRAARSPAAKAARRRAAKR